MMRKHLFLLFGAIVACGDNASSSDDGGNPSEGGTTDGGVGSDGGVDSSGMDGSQSESGTDASASKKVVFVIPLENKSSAMIYGNTQSAPYINGTLIPAYAHTTMFGDELPSLVSEPHYVWMESGTNVFADHTFSGDSDSSPSNSTNSTEHLVTQLGKAGVSWMSYQEGLNNNTGACPIKSSGFYAAKHDPFVFFQDVSGNPPSQTNMNCAMHHKPLTALAGDLQNSAVAQYNFITPNLCNDMHGDGACSQSNTDAANIKAGDDWLKNNLPAIITYALAHDGYVFVVWDEGDQTNLIPFIAISAHAKKNYAGGVKYTHSSLLKSEELILGVPVLAKVTNDADFADLFDQGYFP
jgi:hypothetical protein